MDAHANPFPGLRSFRPEEAHLFFGRDRHSDELVQRLASQRFLAVVGTSGSGKSSLVLAGLLPSLASGFMADAGAHWRIAIVRPQDAPIRFLARALVKARMLAHLELTAEAAENVIDTILRRSSLGLVESTRLSGFAPHENLLVVVDQFEELFRFADLAQQGNAADEAAAFVKLLLEATRQTDVPAYVVVTMRSDYLGDCTRFRSLPEAISNSQFLIPRLTRDELEAAIRGPIGVGIRQAVADSAAAMPDDEPIASGLVQQLLNDVGDDMDQLPVLQHALMRTWNWWAAHAPDRRPIDVSDLNAIGGMSEALSRHADEAYASLQTNRHRVIAERLFKCLTEKGPDNREVRRPTRVSRIGEVANVDPGDVIAVANMFRAPGRSFLMPPADVALGHDSSLDISHESLIRQWTRLRTWVDQEAESGATYLRLAEAAQLHRSGLGGLWGEPNITHARQWLEREAPNAVWAARYAVGFDEACAFLIHSEAEDRARLDRERQHIASEAAARTAEAAAIRQRRLSWGLAAMLLVAAIAAGLALRQTGSLNAALTDATTAKTYAEAARVDADIARTLAERNAREAFNQTELAKTTSRLANEERLRAEDALAAQIAAEDEYRFLRADVAGPGQVLDEAFRARRTAASFRAADEDYFATMDGGVSLSPEAIQGRNSWMIWTAGNDRFWNHLATLSNGSFDLLKTLSSHPVFPYSRDARWRTFGLINEPCFKKATGPDPNRYGLWLDGKDGTCAPPDPFQNANKYPGVEFGARGRTVPTGSFYGEASGVVGLRLFPNPDFDEEARKKWDSDRYYRDPSYYRSPDLVRPYRVGMSCAFCHVGPDPLHPPADPENPRWENLNSAVGAQYLLMNRIFDWANQKENFVYEVLKTSRPGTVDMSFVATDGIDNPRAINPVYELAARLSVARKRPPERLLGGSLKYDGPPEPLLSAPDTITASPLLRDGSDSIGFVRALSRWYLNIGTFSEEWLLHVNPLVGGRPVTPLLTADARTKSVYFQVTEAQTPQIARFLLQAAVSHHLKDAPGGSQHLSADKRVLTRGKTVFADHCASCHSSKQPELTFELSACTGAAYLECWNRYWERAQTEQFKEQIREIVLSESFLEGNFLSVDMRVPITLVQTNACSSLASNATSGEIWDNFSSQSYKELPSVGSITWYHPITGAPQQMPVPGGGRGYIVPPSLVSLWSTAPFLHNNSVGPFFPSPSVQDRIRAFQGAIEQLLWPERRRQDPVLRESMAGTMDRTTLDTYLRITQGYLPYFLQKRPKAILPEIFRQDGRNEYIELGPILKGTPVGLLSNLRLLSESADPTDRLQYQRNLAALVAKGVFPRNVATAQSNALYNEWVNELLTFSKCPDLVLNRGHLFGSSLPDADKRALIEFLKTF